MPEKDVKVSEEAYVFVQELVKHFGLKKSVAETKVDEAFGYPSGTMARYFEKESTKRKKEETTVKNPGIHLRENFFMDQASA